MNYAYENYLYIYNIKLMKENTLLIKKITFKHVFCFIYSKKTFLLTQSNMFFFKKNKICFPKFNSQTQLFFKKHKKIVIKNCFSEQFSKHNNQTSPKL